jgi:hypothetical protein
MRASKWIVFGVALGMMAVGAELLERSARKTALETPGVRVSAVAIYDEDGKQISTESVVFPKQLPGLTDSPMSMTATEVAMLPRDTTFGRHGYLSGDLQTEATVVLMGTDRASIHRPQWCLTGAGWAIDRVTRDEISMSRPYSYRLPVNKLFLSRGSQGHSIGGVYVYWYVSKDKITAKQLGRLWSATWTALTKGVRERWAYISYFTPCPMDKEQETFEQMEKVIAESAPTFQLVAGPRQEGQAGAVAARN